jgi:hypothetical protein
VLLERGEADRLLGLCDDLRQRSERTATLTAVRALAATLKGDMAQMRRLADPERWLTALHPALPEGFDAALAAELEAHPALAPLPSTKATQGEGRRLSKLQDIGGPLAQELLGVVRRAVSDYIAAHADLAALGYRNLGRLQIESWALISGPDAHEAWHIHPSASISGVYYVTTPANRAADPDASSIEFGPLSTLTAVDLTDWPRERIQPQPGLLLLFPSHMAHRTWPSGSDRPRISVAFDAVVVRDADAA